MSKYSEYILAAFDSTDEAKKSADFVCDGKNDAEIINGLLGGGRSVKLFFRNGTYIMRKATRLPASLGFGGVVIGSGSCHRSIVLEGECQSWLASYPDYEVTAGVRFIADRDMLSSLPPDEYFRLVVALPSSEDRDTEDYPGKIVSIKNISLIFPTNQRDKTVGFDFSFCSGMNLENAFIKVDVPYSDLPIPLPETVAVWGPVGCKFSDYNLKNCWAMGFGKGYRMGGENIVAENCYAYYCLYPFYLFEHFAPHSSVFIKCGEERCKRGIYFGEGMHDSTLAQFIAYDIEFDPTSRFSRDEGAVTVNGPFFGGGEIHYCATQSNVGGVSLPFWKEGNGLNFKTVQAIDRRAGKTSERPCHPQYLQEYFDTELNKKVIYNGSSWVDA